MGQALTNLDIVRAWLGIPAAETKSDELLRRLIKAASAFILNYCNRDTFSAAEVTDVYDTFGNSFVVLRQLPVQSVSFVGFDQQTIPAQPAVGRPGYILDRISAGNAAQRLTLMGYAFPNARSSTTITYVAGYQNTERWTIPGTPYQVQVLDFFVESLSVVGADGTVYVKVAASPVAGQYSVDEDGLYTFAAADTGKVVDITYGTVPADIVQAATELIGERFKTKDRIGKGSESLAGRESVTYFSTRDMNSFVTSTLRPYRRVI